MHSLGIWPSPLVSMSAIMENVIPFYRYLLSLLRNLKNKKSHREKRRESEGWVFDFSVIQPFSSQPVLHTMAHALDMPIARVHVDGLVRQLLH